MKQYIFSYHWAATNIEEQIEFQRNLQNFWKENCPTVPYPNMTSAPQVIQFAVAINDDSEYESLIKRAGVKFLKFIQSFNQEITIEGFSWTTAAEETYQGPWWSCSDLDLVLKRQAERKWWEEWRKKTGAKSVITSRGRKIGKCGSAGVPNRSPQGGKFTAFGSGSGIK